MPKRARPSYDLRDARDQVLSADELADRLLLACNDLVCERHLRAQMRAGAAPFAESIAAQEGSVQVAWETTPECVSFASGGMPAVGNTWWPVLRAATATRLLRPTLPVITRTSANNVLRLLPRDDQLHAQQKRLQDAMRGLGAVSEYARKAPNTILKLMFVNGYDAPEEIREEDLTQLAGASRGMLALDSVDALLCMLGVFERSPLRGYSKAFRAKEQPTVAQLVAKRDLPERFKEITIDYLDEAVARLGYAFSTTKARAHSVARFWRFIDERFPEIQNASEITPAHGRAFTQAMIERSRVTKRGHGAESTEDDRLTVYGVVGDVRMMFHDLATWAIEPGSRFADRVPMTPPLKNRDLLKFGVRGALAKKNANKQRHVFDLERELPGVRAYALATWDEARLNADASPRDHALSKREGRLFWRWALLELFIQSGLRIEEALELTTLDVFRRKLPDGRVYYLLHVKPSKNGRARLIPIGDELGRLIAEIVRHVKGFYGSSKVPAIDAWDFHENQLRPKAPYLLQANGAPRALAQTTVRELLREVSFEAGAQRFDGSPLHFSPHDGRRVFASEHLNHNTPVHVIAALLGHAGLDTVMIYAKLYPKTLVEEYRKAVRGSFISATGPESVKNPTPEEWAEFERSCSLRDMGTHICALPTGDHCERGLVCLGCNHAQPKRSAEPVFKRMLVSHKRELGRAQERSEPAGQLAARELEVHRIETALKRSRALPTDVATAIEATV